MLRTPSPSPEHDPDSNPPPFRADRSRIAVRAARRIGATWRDLAEGGRTACPPLPTPPPFDAPTGQDGHSRVANSQPRSEARGGARSRDSRVLRCLTAGVRETDASIVLRLQAGLSRFEQIAAAKESGSSPEAKAAQTLLSGRLDAHQSTGRAESTIEVFSQ